MTAGGRDFQPDPDLAATQTGTMVQRELAVGEMVAGRFRILRMLGMGGMGLVYHAHDTELDVDVALKLLRPELASRPDAFERFRQELLLARQVSSPHVVRIHDLVRHEQAWLISMDYVAGKTLERLLTEQPRFTPERALDITRQLALGLAAAHKRNVIHRDLKPANVMVDEDGEARITDFGVARSAGETGITGSGVVIGTPEYLSPEQARAEPLDARSDLYALGLILFEMLTGTLPFRGGTPAEMLVQRIVRDPPSADTIQADLPPFAVKLCAWLLELRVTRRIASAEAVVQAIDSGTLKGMPRRDWSKKPKHAGRRRDRPCTCRGLRLAAPNCAGCGIGNCPSRIEHQFGSAADALGQRCRCRQPGAGCGHWSPPGHAIERGPRIAQRRSIARGSRPG
jgi:serine/threonine protein kinase